MQIPKARTIKSYVLRQGRPTSGQVRAIAALWPRYGLEYQGNLRDLNQEFGRSAEKILEIGFGNGEALLAAAISQPDKDYLGIEVHRPGVGRLLLTADQAGISNLRILHHDAIDVLQCEIADASLAEVRLYFPDPWHKVRHHKRRIVQPEFVALIARKLMAGGMFHLATDWAPYARHMLRVLEAEPAFRNRLGVGQFSPRPEWRVATRFQQRGEKLGHEVFDLVYDKL